jgi:hypothetical protein
MVFCKSKRTSRKHLKKTYLDAKAALKKVTKSSLFYTENRLTAGQDGFPYRQ